MVHELMHALGVHHEHTRKDRNKYIHVVRQNVIPQLIHNYDIYPKAELPPTKFDFKSVMLYEQTAFGQGGKITWTPVNPKRKTYTRRQKALMSHTDIQLIRKMYNCDNN